MCLGGVKWLIRNGRNGDFFFKVLLDINFG